MKSWILRLDGTLQKRILRIAIPNGVESGIFQLVKVALSSVVALFGTYQIAANGVAQSIWSMAALVCVTMGPVFITVIGQCMGAGEIEQAEIYFRKLMKITMVFAAVWNALIFAVTPVVLSFYALEEETKQLTILLVLIHNVCNAVAFPFADPLGKGLRAAGDVKFTMIISLVTTIGVRLVFSVFFGIILNMGVIGIALAMCLDYSWDDFYSASKRRKVENIPGDLKIDFMWLHYSYYIIFEDYISKESSASSHICIVPSRYKLAYSSDSSIARALTHRHISNTRIIWLGENSTVCARRMS